MTSGPEGVRRFEIVVPVDATPDDLKFLLDIADQSGFSYYERSDQRLMPPDINRVATEYWGNDTNAGTFANGILQQLHEQARGGKVMRDSTGLTYVALMGAGLNKKTAVIGGPEMRPSEVKGRVYELLDNAPTPFDFTVTRYEGRGAFMQLVPEETTKDRLGRFVTGRGYIEHQLHEDIGKALDTLVVAAGLQPGAEKDARLYSGETVSWSSVVDILESEGFNAGHRKALRSKVDAAVHSQIVTGQPHEHGEVIIKGSTAVDWTHIAVQSLKTMANHYQPHAVLHPFLQEYRWQ